MQAWFNNVSAQYVVITQKRRVAAIKSLSGKGIIPVARYQAVYPVVHFVCKKNCPEVLLCIIM